MMRFVCEPRIRFCEFACTARPKNPSERVMKLPHGLVVFLLLAAPQTAAIKFESRSNQVHLPSTDSPAVPESKSWLQQAGTLLAGIPKYMGELYGSARARVGEFTQYAGEQLRSFAHDPNLYWFKPWVAAHVKSSIDSQMKEGALSLEKVGTILSETRDFLDKLIFGWSFLPSTPAANAYSRYLRDVSRMSSLVEILQWSKGSCLPILIVNKYIKYLEELATPEMDRVKTFLTTLLPPCDSSTGGTLSMEDFSITEKSSHSIADGMKIEFRPEEFLKRYAEFLSQSCNEWTSVVGRGVTVGELKTHVTEKLPALLRKVRINLFVNELRLEPDHALVSTVLKLDENTIQALPAAKVSSTVNLEYGM